MRCVYVLADTIRWYILQPQAASQSPVQYALSLIAAFGTVHKFAPIKKAHHPPKSAESALIITWPRKTQLSFILFKISNSISPRDGTALIVRRKLSPSLISVANSFASSASNRFNNLSSSVETCLQATSLPRNSTISFQCGVSVIYFVYYHIHVAKSTDSRLCNIVRANAGNKKAHRYGALVGFTSAQTLLVLPSVSW